MKEVDISMDMKVSSVLDALIGHHGRERFATLYFLMTNLLEFSILQVVGTLFCLQ